MLINKDSILLPKDKEYLLPMYKDLYPEVLQICVEHGATLDVSCKDGIGILRSSKKCRSRVRMLYNDEGVYYRNGNTMYIRGA
jgi:hypothetical protein